MKILQLCLSDSLGGLELYCLQCTAYLANASQFQVLSLVKQGSRLHQKMQESKLPCLAYPKQTGKIPLLAAKKLWDSICEEGVSIVHVHCKKDLPLAALLKYFAAGSLKIVHTRQMDLPHSKKDPYHRLLYRSLDLLITITQKLRSQVISHIAIAPEKVVCLYYGVPAPSPGGETGFRNFVSKHESHPPAARIAVFGNLNPVKAQHVIVEAMALLKQPDWKLYLVGKFLEERYQQRILEAVENGNLANQVVITGFVDNARQLMAGFDLIVLTTSGETFGLVLAEAMRAQVAVIGTDSGGVPEIIEHHKTGLLVPPENPQALAEAISLLITQPEKRANLAKSGKAYADQQFDVENHFLKLIELFLAVGAN